MATTSLGMKAIDYEMKGNIVRIYLGREDLLRWWGDDWDDAPYEHNAGTVYEEFVTGHVDVAFPYDAIVLEPCDGEFNSPWHKDDMAEGRVPMLAVMMEPGDDSWHYENSFSRLVGDARAWLMRMGDKVDVTSPSDAFPEGTTVLGCVVKDPADYIRDDRENVLRHLEGWYRMTDDEIPYLDRLAFCLLGTDSVKEAPLDTLTSRIIELVDGKGHESLVWELGHLAGTSEEDYVGALSIYFGLGGAEYAADPDESEVTARLAALIRETLDDGE